MDLLALFDLPSRAPPLSRADAHDIAAAVVRHCRRIGCDESNTRGAVATALRAPGHTLEAIRAGKKRAEQLRYRQPQVPA